MRGNVNNGTLCNLYDDLIKMPNPASIAPPPPLMASRLSDRLAVRLAEQIESGALAPGDRLPTEQQLALAHGVSRTVVREAVHQLKSRNLLLSRQGSGVFVVPAPLHQPLAFDPKVLESVKSLVHVVEVRRVLEGEIAALAAQRATRTQVASLRRVLKAIDLAVAAGRDGVDEDLAFHRAIGECTGNPQFSLLLGFLEQYLREGIRITRANEARRQPFMEEVRQEHRAIFDAIAAGDPSAARTHAIHHLSRGAQRLVTGGVMSPRKQGAPLSEPIRRGKKVITTNSERTSS